MKKMFYQGSRQKERERERERERETREAIVFCKNVFTCLKKYMLLYNCNDSNMPPNKL